jgi:hypothetical protein
MRLRRLFPVALAFLLEAGFASRVSAAPQVPAAPPPPPALAPGVVDEQAEFDKGRNAYRAQKYDEADARFIQMLDPEHGTLHDKILIRQARMYWAATRLAQHHDEDATGIFETILTEDRDYEPDSLAFPTEVVNAFIDTRSKLHAKLEAIERDQFRRAAERRAREEAERQREAARLRLLEKLAGEAEVTEKHSRWTALLPFGVGQFQNGQRGVAWFFLGAESALAIGGLVAVPVYYVDLANATNACGHCNTTAERIPSQEYLDRANAARDVNLALYGALAAFVIAGAVQGEVAYVPDPVRIKPRAVPAIPDAAPSAKPTPSLSFGAAPVTSPDGRGIRGGTLGISGTF